MVAVAAPLVAIQVPEANWPTKPVRFGEPFPPGGSVDPLARLIGAWLANATGQPFIVDNRSGGSGSIGTALAAKSTPDGYTYVFAFDKHAVNPSWVRNLPSDTLKDLAPVMLICTAPMAVVTLHRGPTKPSAISTRLRRRGPRRSPTARSGATASAISP